MAFFIELFLSALFALAMFITVEMARPGSELIWLAPGVFTGGAVMAVCRLIDRYIIFS